MWKGPNQLIELQRIESERNLTSRYLDQVRLVEMDYLKIVLYQVSELFTNGITEQSENS